MRGYSLLTRYAAPPAPVTFYVELWEQPLWRQALAAAYHWYDMRIFKVPGFKALENFLWRLGKDPERIPLAAKRDIRCYHLTHKGREDLAMVAVDEETFRRLAKDAKWLSKIRNDPRLPERVPEGTVGPVPPQEHRKEGPGNLA